MWVEVKGVLINLSQVVAVYYSDHDENFKPGNYLIFQTHGCIEFADQVVPAVKSVEFESKGEAMAELERIKALIFGESSL